MRDPEDKPKPEPSSTQEPTKPAPDQKKRDPYDTLSEDNPLICRGID